MTGVTIDAKTIRWVRMEMALVPIFVIGGILGIIGLIITNPILLWSGASAVMIVVVVLMTQVGSHTLPAERKILWAWRRHGLKLNTFPLNDVERDAIAWSVEKKTLNPCATAANDAIYQRDIQKRSWEVLEKNRMDCQTYDVKNGCELEDLPKLRAKMKQAASNAKTAKMKQWAAVKHADAAHKKYLAVWDLLTKSQHEGGAGILVGEKYRDPEEYREKLTQNTTPGANYRDGGML